MKSTTLASCCLLPLMIGGCATTAEYGHKIGDWIGHSVDEVYSLFGKPTSTETQPDGGKVVTYEKTATPKAVPPSGAATADATPQAVTNSATPAALPAIAPDNTRTVSCTTRYKTDSGGVIRSWTFDGEGCKAHEAPASAPAAP